MKIKYALGALLSAALVAVASPAAAGTITAVGAVDALTARSQIAGAVEADLNGPLGTNVPLNLYSAIGLNFHTGAFSTILPGIVSAGTASQPGFRDYASRFPAPIAGGGTATGTQCRVCGVVTFNYVVTQVGLTASTNGTQYLTAWDTSGALIGQVQWVPAADSAFVGIDTRGVAIGMIAYGNDDMFAGGTYSVGGSTIMNDTWVWNPPGPVSMCGNGVIDGTEACDDGNTDNTDGCLDTCVLASCGDGWIQTGVEMCDGGAGNSDTRPDSCRTNCMLPSCGDNVMDSGEMCDMGVANSDTMPDACRTTCRLAACGDGVMDTGEACDMGAANSDTMADACRTTCMPASCGDGVMDMGEACDMGAANSDTMADACRTSCVAAACGDSVVDTGEECDGSAGCDTDCTMLGADAGMPMVDAGMASPDAGALNDAGELTDAGAVDDGGSMQDAAAPGFDAGPAIVMDGGCGCSSLGAGQAPRGAALLLGLLGLAVWRRRRRG